MEATSNCSTRKGLCTNAPGACASETLNCVPRHDVKGLPAVRTHAVELMALTLLMAELAEFTSCRMRVESVVYSVLATVSDAWQLLEAHERNVLEAMAHC